MKSVNLKMLVVLLCVASMRAQNPGSVAQPAANQDPRAVAPQTAPAPISPNNDPAVAMQRMASMHQQRLQEMEISLGKMHSLLNDMKTRLAADKSANTAAQKDNIQLWEMMLGHLDKTLAQARTAAIQRGELAGGNGNKAHGSMVYRRPPAVQPSPETSPAPNQPRPTKPN
jgi:hypothetical protein